MTPNPLAGFTPEKIGTIVAQAFEWCGDDIFAAMQEALIDANFHYEALALAETWARMNPESQK